MSNNVTGGEQHWPLIDTKWMYRMLTAAKLRRWDDARHKAYEQILSAQATAHPAIINMPTVVVYLRRISQGMD